MKVEIYISIERGVGLRSEYRQYGYVIQAEGYENQTIKEFKGLKGTLNHVTLAAIIAAFERMNRQAEIELQIMNEFVARMIEKNLKKWKTNGWITSKGKEVVDKEQWQYLEKLLRKHIVTIKTDRHEFDEWMQYEMMRRK